MRIFLNLSVIALREVARAACRQVGLGGAGDAVEWCFDAALWRRGQAAFEEGVGPEVDAADAFKDARRLMVGQFDAVMVVIGHDFSKWVAPGTRWGRALFVGAYDIGGEGPDEL